MRKYKVTFELVSAIRCPEYYRDERVAVLAKDVPEKYWDQAEREGSKESVLEQVRGLRELITAGELIRNIQVYFLDQPEWKQLPNA